MGGVGEIAGGLILVNAGAPTIGGFLVVHGTDKVATALSNSFRQKDDPTHFTQLIQSTGLSPHKAEFIDDTLTSALDFRGSAIKGAKAATKCFAANASKDTKNFKPFTKSNFRHNLEQATDISPGAKAEAHHVFPQKFRNEFKQAGVNIDDPKYGTWWSKPEHGKNAYKYNKQWERHAKDIPYMKKEEILEYGREFMEPYGIPLNCE